MCLTSSLNGDNCIPTILFLILFPRPSSPSIVLGSTFKIKSWLNLDTLKSINFEVERVINLDTSKILLTS